MSQAAMAQCNLALAAAAAAPVSASAAAEAAQETKQTQSRQKELEGQQRRLRLQDDHRWQKWGLLASTQTLALEILTDLCSVPEGDGEGDGQSLALPARAHAGVMTKMVRANTRLSHGTSRIVDHPGIISASRVCFPRFVDWLGTAEPKHI